MIDIFWFVGGSIIGSLITSLIWIILIRKEEEAKK